MTATLGTHGRGRTWQGTGTWHEQVKRLGEDSFFSGAFVVFLCISEILCAFCLVVLRFFVYLQTDELVSPSLTLRI